MEQGKPVKTRFITVVTSFVVCLFASATWAQDSEWTPFTGADNLREKIAGTKFERQLAKRPG